MPRIWQTKQRSDNENGKYGSNGKLICPPAKWDDLYTLIENEQNNSGSPQANEKVIREHILDWCADDNKNHDNNDDEEQDDENEHSVLPPQPATLNHQDERCPTYREVCHIVIVHIQRVLRRDGVVGDTTTRTTTTPMDTERTLLLAQGIDSPRVQSYLCWRRSVLLVANPFFWISFSLAMISLYDDVLNRDVWTSFAKFLLLWSHGGDSCALLFMTTAFAATTQFWTQHRQSQRFLLYGWSFSFVMPLLVALFPLNMLLNEMELIGVSDQDRLILKAEINLTYMITILPTLITFSGGILQGALRVFDLLSSSSAGWVVLMIVPLHSVILCLAMVVIVQIVGDVLLFLAVLVLIIAPWIFVIHARLMVVFDPYHQEQQRQQERLIQVQMAASAFTLLGLFLILVWALFVDVNNVEPTSDLVSYEFFFSMVFNLIGRYLVTTVCFADLVLIAILLQWNHDKKKRDELSDAAYNSIFEEINAHLHMTDYYFTSNHNSSIIINNSNNNRNSNSANNNRNSNSSNNNRNSNSANNDHGSSNSSNNNRNISNDNGSSNNNNDNSTNNIDNLNSSNNNNLISRNNIDVSSKFAAEAEQVCHKACEEAREEIIERAEAQFRQANDLYVKLKRQYDIVKSKAQNLESELEETTRTLDSIVRDSALREKELRDELALLRAANEKIEAHSAQRVSEHRHEVERLIDATTVFERKAAAAEEKRQKAEKDIAAASSEKKALQDEFDDMKSVCEELMALVEGKEAAALDGR